MKRNFMIFIMLFAIVACGGNDHKRKVSVVNIVNAPGHNNPNGALKGKTAIITSENPELQEAMQSGAIKGPDGLYFMPLGKDNGGCNYYTSFSPGKVTLTALYYRKPDGNFTNIRTEADCMVGK